MMDKITQNNQLMKRPGQKHGLKFFKGLVITALGNGQAMVTKGLCLTKMKIGHHGKASLRKDHGALRRKNNSLTKALARPGGGRGAQGSKSFRARSHCILGHCLVIEFFSKPGEPVGEPLGGKLLTQPLHHKWHAERAWPSKLTMTPLALKQPLQMALKRALAELLLKGLALGLLQQKVLGVVLREDLKEKIA